MRITPRCFRWGGEPFVPRWPQDRAAIDHFDSRGTEL